MTDLMTPRQLSDTLLRGDDVVIGVDYVFRNDGDGNVTVTNRAGTPLAVSAEAIVGEFRTDKKAIVAQVYKGV